MSGTGNQHAGFTLLEMLVVLAVTALIAGIGYPALSRMIEKQTFVATVADTRQALRAARAQAVGRGGRSELVWDQARQLTSRGQTLTSPVPPEIAVILSNPAPVFFGDGTAIGGEVIVRSRRFETRLRLNRDNGLIEPRS